MARKTEKVGLSLSCYVCHKPVKDLNTDHTTTIQTMPELKVRHNGCGPGSPKWLHSEVGQKSGIREYYITNGEESLTMGQIPTKIKKAFPKKDAELTPEQRQLVGRVKYMAYMTTVLKEGAIDWMVSGKQSVVAVRCIDGKVSIAVKGGINPILTDILEANASEELRSYFLNLYDEKQKKEKKTVPLAAATVKKAVKPPIIMSKGPVKKTTAKKSAGKGGKKHGR